MIILSSSACGGKDDPFAPEREYRQHDQMTQQTDTTMTIKITAGGKSFSAKIEDTETGKAFMNLLPLMLKMSELGGNEKYSYGYSLPRKDIRFDSLAAGDLMLYSGNCIVLFYGPAGGYNYTRIGRLVSAEGLAAALGKSEVSVSFEKE